MGHQRLFGVSLGLTLLVALAAVLWSGGFGDPAKLMVVATGAGGFLLVALAAPDDLVTAVRSPAVAGLVALTLFGTLALAWGEVGSDEALPTALLPAALAGIAILVRSAVLRGAGAAVTGAIGSIAMVAGISGILGVAFGIGDWMAVLGGREVPSGTFEYPAALALLQFGALPVFASWFFRSAPARAAGVLGLLVAAVTMALVLNRVTLVLVAGLAAVWLLWPPARAGLSLRQVRILLGAGLAVLVTAGVIGLATGDGDLGNQANSGVDHGRVELWSDSIGIAAERPLLGHGPGSFYLATVAEQESPVRFAHNMVVEQAVELGLPGAMLMLVVILGALFECWRRRSSSVSWLFIPMVAGFALMALTDWSWHLAGLAMVWALALGALLADSGDPD